MCKLLNEELLRLSLLQNSWIHQRNGAKHNNANIMLFWTLGFLRFLRSLICRFHVACSQLVIFDAPQQLTKFLSNITSALMNSTFPTYFRQI